MKNKLLIIVAITTILYSCNSSTSSESNKEGTSVISKPKASVVLPVSIDAFDQLKEGITETCNDKIDIKFYSAEGDPSKFETVVQSGLLDNPDYLITVGTQITNTAFAPKFDSKLKTVIAGAISSPELVESLVNVGLNPKRKKSVAIVSDSPKEDIYALFRKTLLGVLPKATSAGIIYNTAEINSKGTAEKIINAIKSPDLKIEEGVINNAEDIEKVVDKLLVKNVSVIIIPHDKYAVTKASSVVKKCLVKKVPVFSLDDGTVKKDGVAIGISVNYKAIGQLIGKALLDIVAGKTKAEDMPIISMDNAKIYVNDSIMQRLNITIPQNLQYLITK